MQAKASYVTAPAIAGALFDFLGCLTSRKPAMRVGSNADTAKVVDALAEWAKARGLSLDAADVKGWLTHNARRNLFALIDAERDRQDAIWGGPEYDDTHNTLDWENFISDWAWKATDSIDNPLKYRDGLVKVAALAVAAIESHDRKQAAGAEAERVASFGSAL